MSCVFLAQLTNASWGSTVSGTALDSLPGWLGEVKRPESQRVEARSTTTTTVHDPDARWLEVMSWKDRIFQVHNFLTPEECDWLVENSKPRMQRSSVVDAKTGGGEVSNIRTSSGMFFGRGESPVIREIEERIAQWTMVDAGQGEGFQVLDYKNMQKYDPHYDYFFHEAGINNGGNRLMTVLMYLTDVEEGGETVFPNVKPLKSQTPAEFSECAMKGLALRPRKGNAAIFWSLTTTGELNKGSLHGSCPVLKGEKFSATKWVHVAHYAMGFEKAHQVKHVVMVPPPPPNPPGCFDDQHECVGWAESGECTNNPKFMVGSAVAPGKCVLSCGRCDLMKYKPPPTPA